MRRLALAVAAFAGLLTLAACSGGAAAPVASPSEAVLDVVLTTPHSDDGAVLIELTGGRVDSVSAAGSYQVYAGAPSDSTRRFMVLGSVSAGVVARVWVPASAAASAYQATVLQAAARGSFAQHVVTGYGATVR